MKNSYYVPACVPDLEQMSKTHGDQISSPDGRRVLKKNNRILGWTGW